MTHPSFSEPQTKQCARCGASFKCLHNAMCWCVNVKISEAGLKLLKKNYTDCLCPSCLNIYAEKTDK